MPSDPVFDGLAIALIFGRVVAIVLIVLVVLVPFYLSALRVTGTP